MYFGESISKLDDKGRITVPRRIRETMDVLGHAVWYMTRGYDHSIFLFHRDEWNDLRKQMGRFSPMDTHTLDLRRYFYSGVAEVRPDPQGRIPVPQHLRDHARIDKEAVLIGVGEHLELWNTDAWRAFVDGKDETYRDMAGAVFSAVETGDAETERGECVDDH